MKPFDLVAALRGEPVVDNEGNKYIQAFYFDKADPAIHCFNLVLVREDGVICSFDKNGNSSICYRTLHMAPRTKKLWIGVKYDNEGKNYHQASDAYERKDDVRHALDRQVIEIEIEV